jgi:uncharacterized protein (DUF305 family)
MVKYILVKMQSIEAEKSSFEEIKKLADKLESQTGENYEIAQVKSRGKF